MSFVIGRGRYAREAYPSPPPPPGAPQLAPPISVVSTDAIPANPSSLYFVELGVAGMPAPTSYTTKSGRVKVTVVLSLLSASGSSAGFNVQGSRDLGSTIFGAEMFLVAVDDTADGLGPHANATFVGIDEVAPGSTHTWGAQVQGFINEGGEHNASQVPAGFASVTVEDVAAA